MVSGGPFLMGVDKEVNKDTEKMSKRARLKYAVSREAFHDEGPAHNVILDAYYIDKYEVSNKHYSNFMKARITLLPPIGMIIVAINLNNLSAV